MKMPPPVTRWLCLFIILAHGVRGQLSVGSADSFLVDDLDTTGDSAVAGAVGITSLATATDHVDADIAKDAADVAVNPGDAADYNSQGASSADDPQLATAIDEPVEETTLPDFDYDLMDEVAVTTESEGLSEDEISRRTGAMEYYDYPTGFTAGLDDGDLEGTTLTVPQLTRRIIYSGGPSLTTAVPEPSVTFTRPSSLVRVLSDTDQEDWLPNWPSHLLDNNGRPTRRPTIRFPTVSPSTAFVPSSVPSSAIVPASTPVPSIDPTFTVSKVPVTQYFFDLPSVVPTPVPGPLFHEEDLSVPVSASPSIAPDLRQPVIELSSSISELQSSVLMEAVRPFTVTPSLSGLGPSVLVETTDSLSSRTTFAATPLSSLAFPSASAILDEPAEREVVDNTLDDEIDNVNVTLVAKDTQDHGTETTGPRPPQTRPDTLGDDPDYFESTTAGEVPLDVSVAALPGTGEPNSLPSDTTSAPVQPNPASESDLMTTTSTSALGSVKPTFIRTSQAANSSRTPLWMLLSQSTPSRTVNTQLLRSQPTSSATSFPDTNTITALATSSSPKEETDPLDSDVSQTPALSSSTVSIDELLETTAQSTTSPVDNSKSTQNDSPNDVITTPIPTEATVTTPSNNVSEDADPTQDITESSTLEPSNNKSSELTPGVNSIDDPSSDVTQLDTDLSENNIPVVLETTESMGEPTDSTSNRSSLSHLPEGDVLGTTTERDQGISDEPIVITLPEEDPTDPPSSQREISPVVTSTDSDRVTPHDSATWTPVMDLTETTVQIVSVTSPSSVVPTTSQISSLPPEMTGGFTPIKSETDESSILPHTEVLPDISTNLSPTSTPAIVESTATLPAPFDGSSTKFAHSPSVTDFSAATPVLGTDLESHFDQSSVEEHLSSSIIIKEETEYSPILFPTTVHTPIKDEFTSISLVPMFTEPVPTPSITVTAVSEVESTLTEKSPEPTIIVTEKLPSSPTEYIPEIFPSSSDSSILATPSSTNTENISSVPSLSSIPPDFSDSSVTPDIPMSSASIATLPTSSTGPALDSPTLVAPTATDVPTTSPTQITTPEVPTEGTEEGTHEELPEEEVSTVAEIPSSTPKVPTPISVTTPTTSTTTKTSTTKVTVPPTTSTSPVPTTPSSEVPTFMVPTETIPSLTTTVMLPNGTMIELPLPYIRALVAYSNGEFCHHKQNFRTMLAQWISQHLEGKTYVEPRDIEFFNMPDCVTTKPSTEDHINHLPEDLSHSELESDDKMNLLLDNEKTNVYFYVTSSGKIDPELTEQFPLFPMDLEISEDLTYLKTKVSQLELVRADGSTNSDPLLEEVAAVGTSVIVIIVICSIVGITIIVALLFFMVVKRRGATNNYYGRRCTPVSMDAYSMDSVSVYHSFRRKSKRRASGRSVKSYLNQAFDDPNGPTRPLNFAKLTHFISDIDGVYEEFGTIPVNMPKYANVIPVPETRVLLKLLKDSRNSEYINANYVRGARNESKYYIATQAPLDDTVADFWRMIWEQETKVVVMLTDFVEKGIDKCADYLPPSETLDCHRLYGDFQVTLKSRDMREKYVVSNVQLKNLENNLVREVAHMWFTGWPASGVPNEETAFISYILDVRRTRKKLRAKGPIVVHCSPGTGRTGTLLACDIVMKQFEDQRSVDVPRTVYSIRRDRAGAVQTKEQYAFIYRVINLYASKLTSGNLDSL
ncbi:Tyrosine-protein phosphatase non-receptor type 7-like [Homarus americanus]|uniref:Tyrosine-protein phosphatase non-receptor type 7-like n=1 Tax=Homarus americanus TaxID=6706 RepID=A0A8J5KJQ3_HOMAM|nr:Tyrosine-protein phosphatase non-receptor type 7-like [Homarus americanus]